MDIDPIQEQKVARQVQAVVKERKKAARTMVVPVLSLETSPALT